MAPNYALLPKLAFLACLARDLLRRIRQGNDRQPEPMNESAATTCRRQTYRLELKVLRRLKSRKGGESLQMLSSNFKNDISSNRNEYIAKKVTIEIVSA